MELSSFVSFYSNGALYLRVSCPQCLTLSHIALINGYKFQTHTHTHTMGVNACV